MFQQLVDKAEREPSLLVKIYQSAQARKVAELPAGTMGTGGGTRRATAARAAAAAAAALATTTSEISAGQEMEIEYGVREDSICTKYTDDKEDLEKEVAVGELVLGKSRAGRKRKPRDMTDSEEETESSEHSDKDFIADEYFINKWSKS